MATAVAKEFSAAFPDRVFVSPLIDLMRKNGREGTENNTFFVYACFSKMIHVYAFPSCR